MLLELRLREGYFPIPLWLHRDQIEKLGYDASNLTDGDMQYLAQRMANDFLESHYLEALRETVDYYMKQGKPPETADP